MLSSSTLHGTPPSLRTIPSCSAEALYRQHHRWLNHWLRKRVASHADAEELVQETFLRVLYAQSGLQADGLHEPRAYLATVANRLVANFYRRQSIEQAYAQALASMPVDVAPSPETQALIKEALLELDHMLDGLGPKAKQAFLLAQFENMPYAEIALRLNVSLRSVKYYIARALTQCCRLAP